MRACYSNVPLSHSLQPDHRASALQPNTKATGQQSVSGKRKLTLGLILPAILVPCTLMILLVLVIAFGMFYFRSETERLGRAFAPRVDNATTLLVTDIQVCDATCPPCLVMRSDRGCIAATGRDWCGPIAHQHLYRARGKVVD